MYFFPSLCTFTGHHALFVRVHAWRHARHDDGGVGRVSRRVRPPAGRARSSHAHCRNCLVITAFPRPPTAFHRPSATFSCPSLPSHCLSLTLNCRCALPFPRPVIVSVPFLRRLAAFPSASHRTIPAAGHGHRLPGRRHQPPGLRRRVRPTPVCGTKEMSSALFDAPTCHLFGCSLTKHLLCILPERHQRDCISPV